MWRRLIFDRGCFSEGVVVKCSAIYAKARSTVQPDCYALLGCDWEQIDCGSDDRIAEINVEPWRTV